MEEIGVKKARPATSMPLARENDAVDATNRA